MELELKMEKTAGRNYLKARKQDTSYRVTYLEIQK